MHRIMKKQLNVYMLLAVTMMLTSVANAATINFKVDTAQTATNSNSFSGNGKNDKKNMDSVSVITSGLGQIVRNTKEATSQGITSGFLPSGDVSLSQQQSGSGQQTSETSTTGKRAADDGKRHNDLPDRAICRFEMVKDVSETRNPQTIMVARAIGDDECLDPNSSDRKTKANEGGCEMVEYNFQVQQQYDSGDGQESSWKTEFIPVPVARVCAFDKQKGTDEYRR